MNIQYDAQGHILFNGQGQIITSADGAPCCCDATPENVYAVGDCCDSFPIFYLTQAALDKCVQPGGVWSGQIDGLCMARGPGAEIITRQQAEDRGERIVGPDEVTCRNGCDDPACRVCPTDCCIVGYLPDGCAEFCVVNPAPGSGSVPCLCCNLGRKYRLQWRREYRRREWRATFVSDTGCPNQCIVPPLLQFTDYYRIETSDGTYEKECPYNGGEIVTGTQTYAEGDNLGRTADLQYAACSAVWTNITDSPWGFTNEQPFPRFALGALPGDIGTTDDTQPDPCNYDYTLTKDPCGFPIGEWSIDRRTNAVQRGCDGGTITSTRRVERGQCAPCAGAPVGTPQVTTEVVEEEMVVTWSVTILDRTGCEGDPCDTAGLPPGTLLGAKPEGVTDQRTAGEILRGLI